MPGFLLRGDHTLLSQQIKCGVNGHAVLTELSTETPRPGRQPDALLRWWWYAQYTHAYIHV